MNDPVQEILIGLLAATIPFSAPHCKETRDRLIEAGFVNVRDGHLTLTGIGRWEAQMLTWANRPDGRPRLKPTVYDRIGMRPGGDSE